MDYKHILLAASMTLFAGCTTPYNPVQIFPEDVEFHGAHPSSMNNNESSLIMIHGMCHHDEAWVDKSRTRIAKYFQMQKGDIDKLGLPVNEVQAYKTTLQNDKYVLTLYNIVYGPSTKPIKDAALCKDVSSKTDVCKANITYKRERASLNASLKNDLVNNCLADAVIYLSDEGEAIRAGVKSALAAIYDDRNDPQAPIVFLSESLGSKVLRDALLCEPNNDSDKGLALVAASDTLFLSANQIPLLNLGNGTQCDGNLSLEKSLRRSGLNMSGGIGDVLKVIQNAGQFNIKSLEGKRTDKTYLVVSFTDPNDLLSYEVNQKEFGENKVVNVIVSNDKTWLGWIENPLVAHSDYLENDEVIKILKCGWKNEFISKCNSM